MGTKRKLGDIDADVAGETENVLTKKAPTNSPPGSHELHELLKLYYQHMFPAEPYLQWLSYGKGNEDKLWTHREFSFNSEVNGQEIYQRYKSFDDVNEFTKLLRRQVPLKIDIGAVFNKKPKFKQTVANLEAEEKELVIDIDISDYDDVRTCCQDKAVCDKCWPIMNCAIDVLNEMLETEFGFDHRLFIFSGRRGVHCWVGDAWARKLDTNARSAFISYLSITPGKRESNISGIPDWIDRAFRICKPYFLSCSIETQEILKTEEQILRMLEWIQYPDIRQEIGMKIRLLGAGASSSERWNAFENVFRTRIEKTKEKEPREAVKIKYNYMELVLFCIYPRLDVEVTRHMNHLLKSPFCVHPKTGKLCVPLDTENLEAFSPNKVPTLHSLVSELNEVMTTEKKSEITWRQIPSMVTQVQTMKSVFLDSLLEQGMTS